MRRKLATTKVPLPSQDYQHDFIQGPYSSEIDFSKIKPPLDIELRNSKSVKNIDKKSKKIQKTNSKKSQLKMKKMNKSDLKLTELNLTPPQENNTNCNNNIDVQLIETYLKQALLESGLPISTVESSLNSLFTSINNVNTVTMEDNNVNNSFNLLSTNDDIVNDTCPTLVNKPSYIENCNTSNSNVTHNSSLFEQNNIPNDYNFNNEQISLQTSTQINNNNNTQNCIVNDKNNSVNIPNSFQLLHVAYKNPKRHVRKRVIKKVVKQPVSQIAPIKDYDHDFLMKEAGIIHVSDIPLPPTPPPPQNNSNLITTNRDLEKIDVASTNVIQNTTSKRKQNLLKNIREDYNIVKSRKIKTPIIKTTKLKPILPRHDINSELQILTPINLEPTGYTLVEVDTYGNVIYVDNNTNVYTNIIEIDNNHEQEIISENNCESEQLSSTQNEIDLLLNFAEKSSNITPVKNQVDESQCDTEKLEPSKIIQNIVSRSRNLREKSLNSDNMVEDEDDTADIEIFDDSDEELENSTEKNDSGECVAEIEISTANDTVPLVPINMEENKQEEDNISVITLSDNEEESSSNNIQLSENKENESLLTSKEINLDNTKPETVEDQIKFFKKFETFFKILKKEKDPNKINQTLEEINESESIIVKKNKPGKYTIELMRRFFCPFCTKSFTDLPGTLSHGKNIHGKDRKSLKFSIEAREMHVIRCTECKHIHVSYDSFRKHVAKYHPVPKDGEKCEEQINCVICYAPYFRKCDLTRHQHREHGMKTPDNISTPLDLLGAGMIDYSDIIDLDMSNDSIGNIQIYNFDDADDLLNYHSNPVPHVEDIDTHFEDLFTIIEQPMPAD